MKRLAIVEPMTLVGQEIRASLASHNGLRADIELFTSDPELVGAVTESAGRAAYVQHLDHDSLRQIDLVIFCGRQIDLDTLEALPPSSTAILIDPESSVPDAVPVVAGVNLSAASDARVLISPNAGVILLAHLLFPFRDEGLTEVVAHLLQPASSHDEKGLDELFEQTRAILSMSDQGPEEVYGTQLAFNLLPTAEAGAHLVAPLRRILGGESELALHVTQAAVFHCFSASVFIRLRADCGSDGLRARMAQSSHVEIVDDPEQLGPIRAASAKKILVGSISPAPGVEGAYWIWCVMDNLTCGGVANTLALAETRVGADPV